MPPGVPLPLRGTAELTVKYSSGHHSPGGELGGYHGTGPYQGSLKDSPEGKGKVCGILSRWSSSLLLCAQQMINWTCCPRKPWPTHLSKPRNTLVFTVKSLLAQVWGRGVPVIWTSMALPSYLGRITTNGCLGPAEHPSFHYLLAG